MTQKWICNLQHAGWSLGIAIVVLGGTLYLARDISESAVTSARTAAEAAKVAAEAATAAASASARQATDSKEEFGRILTAFELRVQRAEEGLRATDAQFDVRMRESETFRAGMKVTTDNFQKSLDRIERKIEEHAGKSSAGT